MLKTSDLRKMIYSPSINKMHLLTRSVRITSTVAPKRLDGHEAALGDQPRLCFLRWPPACPTCMPQCTGALAHVCGPGAMSAAQKYVSVVHGIM